MPKLVTTVVRSTAARRRAFPQLTEREREALAVLVGGGYLIPGW
jgi:Flp pilus assembly protein TadB